MPYDSESAPSSILYSSIPQDSAGVRDKTKAPVACPDCGHHKLQTIQRRSVDRFMGLFVTLRRFECHNNRCRWEGNLVNRRTDGRVPFSVSGAHAVGFIAMLTSIMVLANLLFA